MEAEIDLRAIFSFLRRQLRLIFVVLVSAMAIAAISLLAMAPIYTATALVMVDPSDKNLLAPQSQPGPIVAADARIEGEVLLARSDNVLLTVIDRENLVDSDEFGARPGLAARIISFLRLSEPPPLPPDEALRQTLGRLAAMVDVQRQRSTFLISISASSLDPNRAASLANALAKAYIDTQLTAKVQSTIDARDVLLQQVGAARQDIVKTDGSFDRFIAANLAAIVEQTGQGELAAVQAEIDRLDALRQSRTLDIAALRTQLAQHDFAALTTRLADQAMTDLERERQEVLGRLEQGGAGTAGPDGNERLARIEDDLQSRAADAIADLQADMQRAQDMAASLRGNLRAAILAGGLSPDTLTEIYDLQQRAELARQHYDQLLARAQQLQAEAALQLADSRIVSPALSPNAASFPETWTILLLAGLAGLILGIGIAFVYERFVGGVTSDDQLASIARTKLALAVPRARLLPDQHSAADLVIAAPLSPYSEAIRRIRTSIDHNLSSHFDTGPTEAPIIMVTSAAPGEGKTTLALSIARSYALAGRATLLVDCDLRQPALHRHLGVEASEGLSNALNPNGPLDNFRAAMTEDRQTGLLTLVGSRASGAATDQLLAGRNFERLLAAAAHSFEIVILDTPPLGTVVDGVYIARQADALVMVVNWASTSQQDIRKAFLSLDTAMRQHATCIPVLNRQELSATPYNRSGR